jgi:hypothetical protein
LKRPVTLASIVLAAVVAACGGGAAPAEPQESRLSRLVTRPRCPPVAEHKASAAAASQLQGASAVSKDAKNCPPG